MNNLFKGLFLSILLVGASGCTKKGGANERVLRLSMLADAKNFDPAMCEDYYSHEAQGMVFEGLVEYEYLKRPHQLKPQLAEAMPTVSKDGLTYTFKIKKGVLFQDHAAFPGGKGREVKAQDFVYTIMRVADPKTVATGFWVFDNHLVGLNEWRSASEKSGTSDYSTVIEGVKALDDYTLQIKVKEKYPQLLFALAMPSGWVIAREVVEKTGKDFVNTPVGTGPYKLMSWARNSVIKFERNPTWRGDTYPTEGEPEDAKNGFLADAGKAIPLVDRVDLMVYVEEQPRWLNFVGGNTDTVRMPKDYYKTAVDSKTLELTPDLKAKGFVLQKVPEPDVTYHAFNMEDPVIKKGGSNLRKAIAHAIDHEKWRELFYNNAASLAQSPIPPGLAGYDPNYKNSSLTYDVAKAKEYLKKAGYPGGKGLTITYESTQGTDARQQAEKLQGELAAIGITLNINVNQFSELTDKINKKKAQMWGIAWIADYPDVENFLQLLYGPNKAPSPNASNFDDPKFNKLFDRIKGMEDSPERRKLILESLKILEDQMPWIPGVNRIAYHLNSARLKNYKAGYMGPICLLSS